MRTVTFLKQYINLARRRRRINRELKKQRKLIEQMTLELSNNLKDVEVKENNRKRKNKYTMVSVFPNEEIMERAFSTNTD